MVQEANPPNEDGRLDKNSVRACKWVQLAIDDAAPNDVWPHLLDRTC